MTTPHASLSETIATNIQNLRNKTGQKGTLKDYAQMVEKANQFSEVLWQQGLKTSQIGNFLESVNRIRKEKNFSKIQSELPLIQQKLTQSANQYDIVKSLKKVIDAAIDKVKDIQDFKCLLQLIDLTTDVVVKIVRTIANLEGYLKYYPIRTLVKDAEELGQFLKQKELKTNQIRKFLDTVNHLKVDISVQAKNRKTGSEDEVEVVLLKDFPKIDSELILIKQKLAYASARQEAVKPLKEIMDVAIEKVHDSEDFERLFQLVESIIAYHKAAEGE